MINLLKRQQGFSLVEIVIATILFSIAAVGTFSTLSMLRRSSNTSERSLQAVYYGRQILEELRAKIDQASWGQGPSPLWGIDPSDPLNPSKNLICDNNWNAWPWKVPPGPPNTPFFSQFGGTILYQCQDQASGVRKLSLTITWNEP